QHTAKTSHRDFLKAFASLILVLAVALSTKMYRPVPSTAAANGYGVGWIGCNSEGRYICTRESNFFGASEPVRRLIAGHEDSSGPALSDSISTGCPISTLGPERLPFKQKLGRGL